jgi:hypothetical protein
MIDYLALGASIINTSFIKEILMIGMVKMPGSHNAENIKKAIEIIINKLNFNKAKISAVVTDEGSNLLRLFKQIEDKFFIEASPNEEDDQEEGENNDDKEQENDDDEEDEEVEEDEEDEEEDVCSLSESSEDSDDSMNVYDNFIQKTVKHEKETSDDDELEIDQNPTNYFTEKEIDSIDLQNQVNYVTMSRELEISVNNDLQDELEEYDFQSNAELITCLELQIGSKRIPRFSCVCHKGNLAIRKAIKASPYFAGLLSSLSKQASKIKKSIVLSGKHRQEKSKIHREQYTRWSSSFMMLISYLKSYKRGIFTEKNVCAASEEEIEKYIQILLPMYIFTNDTQSNKSSIACVIPSILTIIYANLDRMVLEDKDQSLFRDNMIFFLKKKFEFELNSKIYLVASILNVESLNEWKDRSYAKPYFLKAIESLPDVLKIFETKTTSVVTQPAEHSEPDENHLNNITRHDGLSNLTRLLRSKSSQQIEDPFDKIINNEIKIWLSTINEIKITSTKQFWFEFKN